MLGMVSVLPDTKDESVSGALAILSVVGDNNKYAKRLQDLTDLVKQANDAQKQAANDKAAAENLSQIAQKALVDAGKLHDQGVAAKKAAEDTATAAQADVASREAALKAAIVAFDADVASTNKYLDTVSAQNAAGLKTKEEAFLITIAAANAALSLKQKVHDDREKALSAREAVVASAEKDNKDKAALLAKQTADLSVRLAKLRDIVG